MPDFKDLPPHVKASFDQILAQHEEAMMPKDGKFYMAFSKAIHAEGCTGSGISVIGIFTTEELAKEALSGVRNGILNMYPELIHNNLMLFGIEPHVVDNPQWWIKHYLSIHGQIFQNL